MDPELLGELRLAQRQGLLVGEDLSYVRFAASKILQWAEDIEHAKTSQERVKLALIARNDPVWLPWKLLPERIPAPMDEKDEKKNFPGSLDVDDGEGGKLGLDFSEVEFKGSEAIEEYDELMRQLQQYSSGSFSGPELRGPDEGWV